MARGRDRHQARVQAVAALGRTLSRRAKNRCELCADRTSLTVTEVAPAPEEPDADRAVLACDRCIAAMDGRLGPPDTLRFLTEAVWSETPAAQVAAIRMVRQLAGDGVEWATEALDSLYLDPEIEAWVDAS